MGDQSAVKQDQDTYSVPCPFLLDGYEATGETAGKALERLVIHLRDTHTSNLPEPAKSEVKTKLTACANTLGSLPV